MDQALMTMLSNLKKNSGKSLEQWIKIVRDKKFAKHSEIVKYLKTEYKFTHGYANLVALKTLETDAGSAKDLDELIEKQFNGKEHFKPIYDRLLKDILKFGKDIEIAHKMAYVSLRRKKQFAILQPATKSRFEIGLNLKGEDSDGILESVKSANSMCSHKICLSTSDKIKPDIIKWLKKAYEKAG